MILLPKIRTILFTNDCPLDCHYCFGIGRTEPMNMSYEEICKLVEDLINTTPDGVPMRITLTGGEPFVRYTEIQELLKTYPQIQWEFNTSGILLNFERLQFLSNYNVMFNLSVDGGEEIGRYQRPFLNDPDFKHSFFTEFKKVSTPLLYFFPHTHWKTIINKYNVAHLSNIYLDAMQLGFKKFHWTPDLREITNEEMIRSPITKPNTFLRGWDKKEYYDLFVSYSQLLENVLRLLKQGIIPTIETYLSRYINYYINDQKPKEFLDLIRCGVFYGRENVTIFGEKQLGTCCSSHLNVSYEEFIKLMKAEYAENNGVCPNDKDCSHYQFCLSHSCLQDNKASQEKHLTPAVYYCETMKIILIAIKIFMNDIYTEDLYNKQIFYDFCQTIKEKGGL